MAEQYFVIVNEVEQNEVTGQNFFEVAAKGVVLAQAETVQKIRIISVSGKHGIIFHPMNFHRLADEYLRASPYADFKYCLQRPGDEGQCYEYLGEKNKDLVRVALDGVVRLIENSYTLLLDLARQVCYTCK